MGIPADTGGYTDADLQELGGWASLQMPQRYSHLEQESWPTLRTGHSVEEIPVEREGDLNPRPLAL